MMTLAGPPFKTVVTHGFTVSEEGEKQAKSTGMALLAEEVARELGADIMRLWISSVNFTDDIPTSMRLIAAKGDPYRKIRNTLRYMLGNLYDFDPERDSVPKEQLWEIDRWALARLNELIRTVERKYEQFEFHGVYHSIYNFCVVEMSALYCDILKDRLYTFAANSVQRRAAQTALLRILVALTKMLAPILVHTCEEVWEHIPGRKESESVHLALMPEPDPEFDDRQLLERWQHLWRVRAEVSRQIERLRAQKVLGNSLQARVKLFAEDESLRSLLERYEQDLAMIFIVSEAHLLSTAGEGMHTAVEIPALKIRVSACPYRRCERCWNYRPCVGSDRKHPTLCERCIKIVRPS
jgi:isoleucyl-tRNA synthetase